MKVAPPTKPGLFALGFLGAYSVAGLILLFTLREVAAELYSGSGTTHRTTGGSGVTSGNTAASQFEKYATRIEDRNSVVTDDFAAANTDGPRPGDDLRGSLDSGNIPGDGSAPSGDNATQSSSGSNQDSGNGGGRTLPSGLYGGGFFDTGLVGAGGGSFGTSVSPQTSPGGSDTGTPGPIVNNVSPPQNPPAVGPIDFTAPLITDGGPPSGNPLQTNPLGPPGPPSPPGPTGPTTPPIVTTPVPEPLTLSLFAAGLIGTFLLHRSMKKTASDYSRRSVINQVA